MPEEELYTHMLSATEYHELVRNAKYAKEGPMQLLEKFHDALTWYFNALQEKNPKYETFAENTFKGLITYLENNKLGDPRRKTRG